MVVQICAEGQVLSNSLDKRLERWGRWCQECGANVVQGYSSRTVLSRFADDGGIIIGSKGKSIIPIDIESEEIEVLMWRLRGRHPKDAKVIEERYVWNREFSEIAGKSGMGKAQVFERLKAGKRYLEGALDNNCQPI